MAMPRKRDGERMRDVGRSKPRDPSEHISHDTAGADFLTIPVIAPAGNKEWHPIALAWFESLKTSGQHIFYEPSDWAAAMLVAESISRDLGPVYSRTVKEWVPGFYDQRDGSWRDGHYEETPVYEQTTMRGANLSAYLTAMSKLLVTEGDRRSFRLEVDRPVPGDDNKPLAAVADIAKTREELLHGKADDSEETA